MSVFWASLVASRLSLGGCGHEGDQGVPYGLPHGVVRRPVERQAVDDRRDDDAARHELADDLRHVCILAPESVDPADHKYITAAQPVEQASGSGSLVLGLPNRYTANASSSASASFRSRVSNPSVNQP